MNPGNEKVRIKYYQDNMTKRQHVTAYILFSLLIGAVIYIFYHFLPAAIAGGLIVGIIEERAYAKRVALKRQSNLRMQFKEFLDIVTVSISGGSGQSIENAIRNSISELSNMFDPESDIVREVSLIVSDFDNANIPMSQGFSELGERSDINDISSFADIYQTIEGKSSDYSYIVTQTRDIIRDKAEIMMEIDANIASAKTETYLMLILPVLIVVVMSFLGGGFMDALFTTAVGRGAATIGLACTMISYVLAVRATNVKI